MDFRKTSRDMEDNKVVNGLIPGKKRKIVRAQLQTLKNESK